MFEERPDRNNCYCFCKQKVMGFWGGDCHVTHQKRRFRCVALSKIRNQLKKTWALVKAKGSLTLDFQSCMNNSHIYVKNWNTRTSFSAPNIRFQQASGQKQVTEESKVKAFWSAISFQLSPNTGSQQPQPASADLCWRARWCNRNIFISIVTLLK